MRYAALVLLAALPAMPQANENKSENNYEAIRAAMEASAAKQRATAHGALDGSLEKQRASVRRQALAVHQVESAEAADSFFTVAWPAPMALSMAPADCDPLPPSELNGYIHSAAQREGVEPELLRAVIGKESAFRPCAVSPKGAQGLMQLMPATAAMLDVADPFDPRQNIDGGTRFLKMLLDRYSGDLARALGAYNAGPAAVDRFGGVPPYPETVNYVSGILSRAP